MRRIILIIVIAALIGGGGYYLYKKRQAATLSPTGVTPTGSLFPTGDATVPNIEGTLAPIPTSESDGTSAAISNSPFKKLSAHAIAGYDFFIRQDTITTPNANPKLKPVVQKISTPIVRYVSRANGYVYELEGDEPALQVSNIYIPNVYEALFADNGSTALLRFLRPDERTIATYSVPVPPQNPDGTRTQKKGVYFPDAISTLAVSPDGTQTARVIPSTTLGGVLTTATTSNTKQVELYRSPFEEWLVSWPTASTLYLQTKASGATPGFFYSITPAEKKLRRIVGNVPGLTASVSPNGTYVLYSETIGRSFVTKILNTKTNTLKSLNLSILPEKCAWLANEDLICAGNSSVTDATYPDDWYKGVVSFSDQLYRISTAANIYDVLYDNSERSFDMTNLSLDESRRLLFFVDKPTGLLWQYSY